MAESDIQARILKIVRDSFKWMAHKNKVGADGAVTGWPDLIVCIPGGKTVFLEVKRPGEVQSHTQRWVTQRLIEDGFSVYIVDNVGHAVRVLRKEYDNIQEAKSRG